MSLLQNYLGINNFRECEDVLMVGFEKQTSYQQCAYKERIVCEF